ncbi:MAG: hypothetical protein CBD88_07845 [Flavobacteriales bacterium TMED228]|nr:MAG: hypothetical protein CBD88_07845 [Flavobacteriales bacterium TMED228]
MALANRLPDPYYKIDTSGAGSETGSGDAGPGFASIKLTSDQKMAVTRTNSQRVIARGIAGQKWNVDINYHPMTREEFDPVYTFLLQQRGPLTPFFVALPQYRTVKNTGWQAILDNSNPTYTFPVTTAIAAGATQVTFTVTPSSGSYTATSANIPKPGELFTLTDTNSNHTKAYMITMVERNGDLQSGSAALNANQIRLTINPPFAKAISTNGLLTFKQPLIKVIAPTAVQTYSLNTDNLYKFSLKLEEYL